MHSWTVAVLIIPLGCFRKLLTSHSRWEKWIACELLGVSIVFSTSTQYVFISSILPLLPSVSPLCHLPGVLLTRLTPSSVTFVFIPSVTSYSYPRLLSAPLLYPERGPWSQQLPVSQKTPLFPPSVFPRLPPHPLPQHPCGTFPPSPLVHSLLTSAGWGVPLSAGSGRVELSLNWSVEAEFSISVQGMSVSRECLFKYDSN